MAALIENLREAFRQSINGNPWMTDATQAEALDKLENYTLQDRLPRRVERLLGHRGVRDRPPSPTPAPPRSWSVDDNLADLGRASPTGPSGG